MKTVFCVFMVMGSIFMIATWCKATIDAGVYGFIIGAMIMSYWLMVCWLLGRVVVQDEETKA